jgi:signal peptidase I
MCGLPVAQGRLVSLYRVEQAIVPSQAGLGAPAPHVSLRAYGAGVLEFPEPSMGAAGEFPEIRRQPKPLTLRVLALLIVMVLVGTLFIHRYVFAVYIIEGSSMAPTLKDGDMAMVNMLVWKLGRLDRGEIVLVRDGLGGYATKRVVGLPGEQIDFAEDQVYVNRQLLTEPYLPKQTKTLSECPRILLGPDEYVVLGDNRGDSYDSRVYGAVPKSAIVGSYTRAFWACR